MSVQHTHAPVHGIQSSISDFVHKHVEDFKAWRMRREVYRKTESELSMFSARELNELGISAYDIPRIAREEAEIRYPKT